MTGYRRMRRQARRVRRTGMQPMMMFNTGDQLPATAFVVLVRWAWRYRSELAPVFLAAVVLGAGWWLHAAHPHWWTALVVLTVVVAAVLAVAGRRLGIPTRGECLYAAAVAAGAGGWLSAATIAGPFTPPLPCCWPPEDSCSRCRGGRMGGAGPGSGWNANSPSGPKSPMPWGSAGPR